MNTEAKEGEDMNAIHLIALAAVAGMVASAGAADKEDDAIALVKGEKVASLSTDYKGTPFGSLAPYALDKDGTPLFYFSEMAVHAKNLAKNPACSVMVTKVDDKDVFNSARITFVGKLKLVEGDKEIARVKDIFFARYKDAKAYEEIHGFAVYKMEIEKIYYIGGFGDIRWIKAEDYTKGYK